MNTDLIHIAKIFLNQLEASTEFTREEREQVLNTVRNIVFVLLIELRKKEIKMQ